MTHTIHPNARPSKPREEGKTAVNLKGHRLVRRVNGPTALPYGVTVIESNGTYMRRREDGEGWDELSPNGKTFQEREESSTLGLDYPVVVVDLKTEDRRPNRSARRAEAQQERRDARRLRRFKSRRVRAFLAACSPEERAKYAAAGVLPTGTAQ